MPRARAPIVMAVALLATACAPGPGLAESEPTPIPTTSTAPPTTTTTAPDPFAPGPGLGPETPQIAPLDLFPVAPEELPPLDRVEGVIAFHGADAAIRSGRSTTDLDTGTLPAQPTWSRDGSLLALVSLEGRQAEIDIYDGATGTLVAGAPTDRLYFFLSWSHDGSRIAALGPGTGDNGEPQTVLDILDADGAVLHADAAAAESLFVAWDPDQPRLAAHADDRLLRIDADGTASDLGAVGTGFFAPKWIPFSDEVLLTTDIEGSAFLVRRSIDGQDTLRSLGPAEAEMGISVNPVGDVAAVSQRFDVENDPAAERIALPFLPQTGTTRSGSVEIVDLATGDRTEVFTGFTLWTEWNPQGTHLLIYEADVAAGTGTWWAYEHRPGLEPLPATEIATFEPTPIFLRSYLVFGDQFIESPRLWSPDGTEFVYAELTDTGSLIRTSGVDGVDQPTAIGTGEAGFWSPLPPAR